MRIIERILTDLANDKVKAEESLQRLINDKDADVDYQVDSIKQKLKEIVEIDQMIVKWRSYTAPQPQSENNNNEQN